MAQKIDIGRGASRTALSPGQQANEAHNPPSRPAPPRVDATLQLPGVSPRPSTPTGPAHEEPANELAATLDAADLGRSSPISSDRLAQLSAHLPRVPRDTYEIGSEVAKGGIGRVVRARDQRMDRPVAIKELLVWNEAQETRFVHEALLTARLQHPSIVPIYEAGRWPDGEPFYAMKLVSGRSLADLIQERKRLEDRVSLLPHVLAVAQAIAYAHTQRILHRDLKPANVLVGEFGETVVIDWGLAKGLFDKDLVSSPTAKAPVLTAEGLTIEGAVVGTPAYMPPEQAKGDPVDERADIYALGAMLYHLIAAVPPYHDTPWEKLLSAIAEGPPTPLEKHVPTIADELAAIVHKAMARERSRRYATAKELADDLERFQTGQIVAAHTYSASHLLRRFWRRNRPVLSMALATIAVLALVIAYAFVRTDSERRYALSKKREAESAEQAALAARRSAEEASKQATSRADELTLLQAQDALSRDPNKALAWLKTLSPEFDDASELRRIAADAHARGLSRAYRGHTAHVNSIHPFDGGKRFITASDDKTLRVWDAATGESRVLAGHTDEVWFSGASPDGKRVVSVSKDQTVRLWDAATGRELAKAPLSATARSVMFRDDGLVVGTPGFAGGVPWSWRTNEPEVRPLVDPKQEIASSTFSLDGRLVLVERKDGRVSLGEVEGELKPLPFKGTGKQESWQISLDGRVALHGGDGIEVIPDVYVLDTRTGARQSIRVADSGVKAFLSRRGDVVALAGESSIEVYDVARRAVTQKLAGHGGRVYWADFADDARLVVTGGFDRAVKTWNLATGETRSFAGLDGSVSFTLFGPDPKEIFAASSAGDVRVFEPGRAGRILTDHRAPSHGLVISSDGRVASVDDNGRVVITDLDGKLIAEHAIEPGRRMHLLVSPDKTRFAAGASPSKRDLSTLASTRASVAIGTFDGQKPLVVTLPATPTAATFVTSSDALIVCLTDRSVRRIDVSSGAVTELDRADSDVVRIATSGDGARIAFGTSNGTVRLIEVSTGTGHDLERLEGPVTALRFSHDSRRLAVGTNVHTIRVFDLETAASLSIDASGSGVAAIEFSPDDKTIFVQNNLDAVVHRWTTDAGGRLPPLTGHVGPVAGIQLSENGQVLLTSSNDRTARIFDVTTGKSRALVGHEEDVTGALFGPGDHVIVTLGAEGTVRAWPDDLPDTVPALRAWIDAATPDTIHPH